MRHDDRMRVLHMIEAGETALSFCDGMSRQAFQADDRTVRAVVQCLMVIGEAANQVTEPTRRQIDALPWQAIVGMRNRLIHAYFEINVDLVWEVVARQLSPMLHTLRLWLSEQESTS